MLPVSTEREDTIVSSGNASGVTDWNGPVERPAGTTAMTKQTKSAKMARLVEEFSPIERQATTLLSILILVKFVAIGILHGLLNT